MQFLPERLWEETEGNVPHQRQQSPESCRTKWLWNSRIGIAGNWEGRSGESRVRDVGQGVLEWNKMMVNSEHRQLQPRGQADLVEHVYQMTLHGLFADGERVANFAVGVAECHQRHDL